MSTNIFSDPGVHFPDLLPQGKQILESLRPFAYIPQQRRRMIDGRGPYAIYLLPFSVIQCDTERRIDYPLRGNSTQADNDLGLYQCDLISQIHHTGILFLFLRVPVSGWPAFDDISNIHVRLTVKVDDRKHVIQKLTGWANKGFSTKILLLSGTFSDQHDIRISASNAKNYLRSSGAELTGCAGFTHLFQ